MPDFCRHGHEYDTLQHSTSIRILDGCGSTSSRPLSSTKNMRIVSHQVGEELLKPGILDVELGTDVDFVRINVERGRFVDVKVGDPTAEAFSVKSFEYSGKPQSIFISNSDALESVTIKYVLAKLKK